MQWTTEVIIGIQLSCEREHRAAAAACQRRVDIGNDLSSGTGIVHARAGGVEQCCNTGLQEDPRRGRGTGAALEAERLAQSLVIEPETVRYIEHALESLVGREA